MSRTDGQLTAMAGEFLIVGKLFKRGYQASVTLGNAKAIDVLVYNQKNNRNYNVQVKTLRKKNYFPMKKEDIHDDHIYVFVILNDFDQNEEFYIIKGSEISKDINKFFGTSYTREKPSTFPGIYPGTLKDYKDNWKLFDE
jgi:transposase-like protein